MAKDVHATPKTTIEITAQIMQQFELDGRPEVAAKVEKEVVAAMSAYMAVDKAQIAADQACEALMIQQQEAEVFEEDNIAFITDDKSAFEADLAKARDRAIELERAIKDFDAQAAAAKVQSSVNEQLTAVLKQESDQATLNVNQHKYTKMQKLKDLSTAIKKAVDELQLKGQPTEKEEDGDGGVGQP